MRHVWHGSVLIECTALSGTNGRRPYIVASGEEWKIESIL